MTTMNSYFSKMRSSFLKHYTTVLMTRIYGLKVSLDGANTTSWTVPNDCKMPPKNNDEQESPFTGNETTCGWLKYS